jgi:uncharacterized protein (TIGR01732 family)
MGKHPTRRGFAYIGYGEETKRRYMLMGYSAGFALIVVLFILLIVVGSAFC